MDLGFFTMPLHRPEKPWSQALAEDREAILLAESLGYTEAWVGEHFSTKAEQVPSPMMLLATLIGATRSIRLGTGVINLPHHHPLVVAAEAALVDRLGPFGTLVSVGHDWDDADLWRDSMRMLAVDVMPIVSQHASSLANRQNGAFTVCDRH